jgi:hypothetical protein
MFPIKFSCPIRRPLRDVTHTAAFSAPGFSINNRDSRPTCPGELHGLDSVCAWLEVEVPFWKRL